MKDKSNANGAAQIENPCIRNCCLDQHDICVGCFRSYEEIISWHTMTIKEKQSVLVLASTRKPNMR
ncbi:DUF1289 domain-containing protein [Vibrio sp. RC27]